MSAPAVEIPITADTSQAEKEIDSFASSIMGRLTPTIDVLALVKGAFDAVGKAISTATGFLKDSVTAAEGAEKAQRGLASLLGDQYARVQAYNNALSAKLGIDDDDLAQIQAKLIAQGVATSKIEDATRATLGYAAATGKDLLQATRTVSQAFVQGGEEVKRLTDLYRVAEEQSQTFEGRTRALSTAWGDFQEAIGGAVTQSSTAAEIVKVLEDTVRDFTTLISGATGRKAVDDFAAALADLGSTVLDVALWAHEMFQAFTIGFTALRAIAKNPVIGTAVVATILDAGGIEREVSEWERRITALRDRLRDVVSGGGVLRVDPFNSGAPVTPKAGKPGEKDPAHYFSDPFGFIADEEAAKQEAKNQEAIAKYRAEQHDAEAKWDREQRKLRDEEFAVAEQDRARRLAAEHAFWAQLGGTITSGVANYITQIATMAAAGKSIDFGGLFGGLLVTLGQTAIQMGTLAVLAGTLGTVSILFKGVTGGEAGVGAGLALIAGGVAAVAAGSALGASGSASSTAPSTARGSAGGLPGGSSSPTPTGFSASGTPQTSTTVVNIYAGAVVGGTPRAVGLQLRGLIRQADTLIPGRAGA